MKHRSFLHAIACGFALALAVAPAADAQGDNTSRGSPGTQRPQPSITPFDPMASAQSLYGIAADTDSLYTIDPATGEATLVAALNGAYTDADLSGLEVLGGTLYASAIADTNDNFELVSIDPVTGATTFVTDLPNNSFYGAAGNESQGILYLPNFDTESLMTYDPLTDTLSTVGPYGGGFKVIEAMAYDDTNGVLYAYDAVAQGLVTINTATGEVTDIGSLDPIGGNSVGMAFDALSSTLYVSDGDQLFTVDTATAATTLVGKNTASVDFTGLAFVIPEPTSLALLGLGGLLVARRPKVRR